MFMLTRWLWENTLEYGGEATEYLFNILVSLLFIPLDIVLLPFELIAWIIWKVREK